MNINGMIAAGFVLGTLVACSTNAPKTEVTQNKFNDVMYPPISVFYKNPSSALRHECNRFSEESAMKTCMMNYISVEPMVTALEQSNYFAAVSYASNAPDYTLAITTASFDDANAAGLATAALAGATLLLLPLEITRPVKAEVVLSWLGQPIKQLNYQLEHTLSMSLLHINQPGDTQITRHLVNAFLKDAEEQELFTGKYLAATLRSSNYLAELKAQPIIDEYQMLDEITQSDPFEGATLSYARRNFAFDEFTARIYPIRAISWDDHQRVLTKELENLRAQINIEQKELKWHSIDYAPEQQLPLFDGDVKGIQQSMHIVDRDKQKLVATIYMMVEEDKIVQLINTVPEDYRGGTPQQFGSKFMESIVIPKESLYMAKVRQNERTKVFNEFSKKASD